MQIIGNELIKNEYGSIFISQVHQNSNKFSFMIADCFIKDTIYGSGIVLNDTGAHIIGCRIEKSTENGIEIDCTNFGKPQNILKTEVN